MDAVQDILLQLDIQSIEEIDVNHRVTIEVDGFEDLTIEKIGPNRVSVAHHYLQRGDLMCDPEIVFKVEDGDWTPVRYTHHPHTHRHDSEGLDLDGFVERWSENLRNQGFVDAAGR